MINIDKLLAALQQNLNYNDLLKMNDPFYIQNYIQNLMSKSAPTPSESAPANPPTRGSLPEPQVIELHDYIVVRISIPELYDEKDVKVFFSGTSLCIKHDAIEEGKTVILPKPVIKSETSAAVKNRVLEIKMPIDPDIAPEEINVKYSY